jgi:hypothetical protein
VSPICSAQMDLLCVATVVAGLCRHSILHSKLQPRQLSSHCSRQRIPKLLHRRQHMGPSQRRLRPMVCSRHLPTPNTAPLFNNQLIKPQRNRFRSSSKPLNSNRYAHLPNQQLAEMPPDLASRHPCWVILGWACLRGALGRLLVVCVGCGGFVCAL